MNRKMMSGVGLLIIALLFLVVTVLSNFLFSGVRMDLTDQKLFTLSEGSRNILKSVDSPIEIKLYFSEKVANQYTPELKIYAQRAQELLEEFAHQNSEQITLTVIDPEPFSEEEDEAAEFGLQAIPVTDSGEAAYFGVVGLASQSETGEQSEKREEQVISFLQPSKEAFWEYELSKLIYNLQTPKKPVVGVMSSLQVMGGYNMMAQQPLPPWMSVEQLKQLFEVRSVVEDAESIDEDIDVLLIIHPKSLSKKTQYAIDQYVLSGGKAMVFVDPLAELDQLAPNPVDQYGEQSAASQLDTLLAAWGVSVSSKKIIGDAQAALEISLGANRGSARHLGLLGLTDQALSNNDIITSGLENLTVSSAGAITVVEGAKTQLEPVITSSIYSMPIDAEKFQTLFDPSVLKNDFVPTGESYVLAARVSGPVMSAFPDGKPSEDKPDSAEESEGAKDSDHKVDSEGDQLEQDEQSKNEEKADHRHIASSDNIQVLVVADTDILSDRLWVQVQNFMGQQILSPWADNGAFLLNSVENFSGSVDLINIRNRGRITRPFDKVSEIKREAEARYLAKEQELQAQLVETEKRLSELEAQKSDQSQVSLSAEQEQALENFLDQKLTIRKQLREVRHELEKDIEQLGIWLKLINIGLVPCLLTIFVLVILMLRRRQSR